jgi:hypothetical protein
MDAGALEVVIRCRQCRHSTRVKALDWSDTQLEGCSKCGERWAGVGVNEIRQELDQLRTLTRAADSVDLPFSVLFGATRRIRDAA